MAGETAHEVRRDGGTAVLPELEVVDLQPAGLRAQRVRAALVAPFDRPTQAAVCGALGGVDADQLARLVGRAHHLGIARQEPLPGTAPATALVQQPRDDPNVLLPVEGEHTLTSLRVPTGALPPPTQE